MSLRVCLRVAGPTKLSSTFTRKEFKRGHLGVTSQGEGRCVTTVKVQLLVSGPPPSKYFANKDGHGGFDATFTGEIVVLVAVPSGERPLKVYNFVTPVEDGTSGPSRVLQNTPAPLNERLWSSER